MSLDLDEGDPERAEMSPADRRRAARQAADENKSSGSTRGTTRSKSASARDKVEAELTLRLDRAFDRIAKAVETRGDDELAAVIREDSEAMGQGLVSLTRSVKLLRGPLLFMLNLIEPVLAFGRIGRILFIRFRERQYRIQQERAAQQGESEVVDAEVVGV